MDLSGLKVVEEQFAAKVALATEEVMTALAELIKDKPEAMMIMESMNMTAILEAKLAGAFALYEAGIVSMLESTYTAGVILEEASLRALLNQAKKHLASELVRGMGPEMFNKITDGIASGRSPSSLIAEFVEQGFNKQKVSTLVNSTFSNYRNAMNTMMAQKLPANAQWVYVGPYDSRTRESCVEKIEFGTKTYKQILSTFGGMQNGVYNCRHAWEQLGPDPKAQGYRTEKFD